MAVTLIGGLFIWVLSFVMILSVYGRFFKMYMYAALAPIPLSSFAGEPSQNVGKSFLKSYAAVCLEGAVIVLACIIFSVFVPAPRPLLTRTRRRLLWYGAISGNWCSICLFWWAASKCPTMLSVK